MDAPEPPRLYLATPPVFDLEAFPDILARVLDSADIACVRLALAGRDEDMLGRSADALRDVTLTRDVPLVIDDHVLLADRHALDGVHLTDGAKSVRAARKALGPDAIVGAYCAQSRHDGMSAGEAGADYVSFGPVGGGALGDGTLAEPELFEWWSQMIELPVVAEGGLDPAALASVVPFTDFIGIGDEIWSTDDPAATLGALIAPIL
ncbi:MAG: thiamine phosphate synthase [Marinibacterium sp.]|nr:thiamine phosphate synthase [Marinibacterium sp.]